MYGTIHPVGIYNRQNVAAWCKMLRTKPTDRVEVDRILLNKLKAMGYDPYYNPASFYDVNQLWDSLRAFGEGFNAEAKYFYENKFFSQSIKIAYSVFGRKGDYLTPLSTNQEIYDRLKKNASSGLPDRTTTEIAFPKEVIRTRDVIDGKKAFPPCLCQFRTQRKLINNIPVGKTRTIFAYPLSVKIAEAPYSYTLLDAFKEFRTPYLLGKWRIDIGARLHSSLRDNYVYEFDYSRFDASVPKGLIQICFNIIKTWFKEEEHANIDRVMKYFIHTPIVMPDQKLYVGKDKGIPSGSNFTQIIGTMSNFILSFAVGERFKMGLSWLRSFFVGDDSIFSSNKNVALEKISAFLSKFGMTVSPMKSRKYFNNRRYHFIGFDFINCFPTKDLDEVISSMSYPETYRGLIGDSKKEHLDTLIRQILLLSIDSTPLGLKYLGNGSNLGDIDRLRSPSNYDASTGWHRFHNEYIKSDTAHRLSGNSIAEDYCK